MIEAKPTMEIRRTVSLLTILIPLVQWYRFASIGIGIVLFLVNGMQPYMFVSLILLLQFQTHLSSVGGEKDVAGKESDERPGPR